MGYSCLVSGISLKLNKRKHIMILEFITGLVFGHVTLACVTLMVVVLLLVGLELVGLGLVKIILNADHPDAPDVGWKLKIYAIIKQLLSLVAPEPVLDTKTGKWICPTGGGNYLDKKADFSWEIGAKHFKDCLHDTKEEALETYEKRGGMYLLVSLKKVLFPVLLIDTSLYLLQIAFLPTVSILVTAGVVWGVRKLAGMVYTNSKNIVKHEDRITKLEE